MESLPTHRPTSDAQPAAPYSRGAPSPPFISLPTSPARLRQVTRRPGHPSTVSLLLKPQLLSIMNPDNVPAEIMAAVVGPQFAAQEERDKTWRWNMRHEAQSITSSLLVGPSLVARNRDFLVSSGITMVIAVIDPRLIPWQSGMWKTVQDAGLQMHMISAETSADLIHSLNGTVNLINQHLAQVFHQRVSDAGLNMANVVREANVAYASNDFAAIEAMEERLTPLRGRVLLTCESGNSRSITVAVAYLMVMTAEPMHIVAQFVCMQRFCAIFEEEHKRVLLTWSDILNAKLVVSQSTEHSSVGQPQTPSTAILERSPRKEKRVIHQVYEDTETGQDMGPETSTRLGSKPDLVLDRDRYEGRPGFVPFIDTSE
ncbi:hypothetical protein BROUX41_006585 [Berkeleyomyces rouxiae]|uniref:uncharacterized protein n=1 Tax=Berkeleyomyces rouxiae TaxID=2035830 RepID=UPI003B7F2564